MSEYVITIKTDSQSSQNSNAGIAPTLSGEQIEGSQKTDDSFADFAKKLNSLKNVAPVAYALKYADLAVTTEINRVELRTGHSTLQEKLNYEYSMTKSVVTAGAAIVGGLLTQNYLVAIAGAMSLVNIGVQQHIAEQNLNIARQVEGIGIEQANIRAGSGGGRYGRSMQ